MRIGVVADSHVGEALPELPAAVFARLAGVDLILHAGDITDVAVLDRLGELAPVLAVQGDHDRAGGIVLPRARVVTAGGHRIGLTHGRRVRAVEYAAGAASVAAGRPVLLGFHRALRRRFGRVDLVVYGHLHYPFLEEVGGTLFFCPGAVYVPELDPRYEWRSLRSRAYRRFRRGLDAAALEPSVGMIEIGAGGLSARVIPLGA